MYYFGNNFESPMMMPNMAQKSNGMHAYDNKSSYFSFLKSISPLKKYKKYIDTTNHYSPAETMYNYTKKTSILDRIINIPTVPIEQYHPGSDKEYKVKKSKSAKCNNDFSTATRKSKSSKKTQLEDNPHISLLPQYNMHFYQHTQHQPQQQLFEDQDPYAYYSNLNDLMKRDKKPSSNKSSSSTKIKSSCDESSQTPVRSRSKSKNDLSSNLSDENKYSKFKIIKNSYTNMYEKFSDIKSKSKHQKDSSKHKSSSSRNSRPELKSSTKSSSNKVDTSTSPMRPESKKSQSSQIDLTKSFHSSPEVSLAQRISPKTEDTYKSSKYSQYSSIKALPSIPPPPPPPAPPLTFDLFKPSENSVFSRIKNMKKTIQRDADEKTSQTFDAVVSELKLKLDKMKTKDNEESLAKFENMPKPEAPKKDNNSVNLDKINTLNLKLSKNLSDNMPKIADIIKTANNQQKQQCFPQPPPKQDEQSLYETNNVAANEIQSSSIKYTKIKVIKRRNWLTGSTSNSSEQTTSNPNLDITQLSNSSINSVANGQQKIENANYLNGCDGGLLKNSVPVSSTSSTQYPKEISSSHKIISSVANSFKLEVFDNGYSDEDSDDYTKYNRVKFSPTLNASSSDAKVEQDDEKKADLDDETKAKATSFKSTSFSFKNKSNELLKKIQKRNTFAYPKSPKLSFEHAEDAENKLCKSKTEFSNVKRKTIDRSLMKSSINLNASSNTNSSNYIQISPRGKSIAAFSTRNLFRNFDNVSPSDKTSPHNDKKQQFLLTKANLLEPHHKSHNDLNESETIHSFKAKIYDNLMKSKTSTSHGLNTQPQKAATDKNDTVIIKKIIKNCPNVNLANGDKSFQLYSYPEELITKFAKNESPNAGDSTKKPIIQIVANNTEHNNKVDANSLNNKSISLIPSKYSSFKAISKNEDDVQKSKTTIPSSILE